MVYGCCLWAKEENDWQRKSMEKKVDRQWKLVYKERWIMKRVKESWLTNKKNVDGQIKRKNIDCWRTLIKKESGLIKKVNQF